MQRCWKGLKLLDSWSGAVRGVDSGWGHGIQTGRCCVQISWIARAHEKHAILERACFAICGYTVLEGGLIWSGVAHHFLEYALKGKTPLEMPCRYHSLFMVDASGSDDLEFDFVSNFYRRLALD